jgi:peptidoglycan/LPS O-acetylase OafA/YrhL
MHCLAGFFLGCLIYHLNKSVRVTFLTYLPSIAFLALLLFMSISFEGENQKYSLLIFPLSALLIYTLISAKNERIEHPLSILLSIKPLVWLGSISYSLYMTHALILWLSNQFIRVFKKSLNLYPSLEGLEAFIIYTIVLALVLFASWVVYICIEQPFRYKSRQIDF